MNPRGEIYTRVRALTFVFLVDGGSCCRIAITLAGLLRVRLFIARLFSAVTFRLLIRGPVRRTQNRMVYCLCAPLLPSFSVLTSPISILDPAAAAACLDSRRPCLLPILLEEKVVVSFQETDRPRERKKKNVVTHATYYDPQSCCVRELRARLFISSHLDRPLKYV